MVIVFAVAAVVTAGLIILIGPLARRIGLVDHPGGRKQHRKVTPLTGGVAIFCAFMLLVPTLDVPLDQWRAFILASVCVFITGLLDDFQEIPPSIRFIGQAGAALIIVLWGGACLKYLGPLFGIGGDIGLGWLAVPFSIFCVVGIINATNMMDGLDGLSGGVLLLLFSALLLVVVQGGRFEDALILSLICGVLAGFLLFNFRFREHRPASVFLGDAGALFLGLAAAWFLVRLTQEPISQLRPITAVWLFGLPIMDTVAIMVRRIRRGRSPFAPDREHAHHILLLAGFSVRSTVLIMLGVSLMFTVIGLGGEWLRIPEPYMFYGFLLLFMMYFHGINRARKLMKTLRRVPDHRQVRDKAGGGASV